MSEVVPLESWEQIQFVNWLDLVGLKHTSVPNSTWTTSWKQKSHNKHMGLHAGFPDLIVCIPHWQSKDGQGHLVMIEMKRRKGGVISAEQKVWIAELNMLGASGVEAHVAKGAEEAINLVCRYVSSATNISPY